MLKKLFHPPIRCRRIRIDIHFDDGKSYRSLWQLPQRTEVERVQKATPCELERKIYQGA